MTTNPTPTAYPVGTCTIKINEKGKMRIVDAHLLVPPEKEFYRKQTELNPGRATYDDGMDMLEELQDLAKDRREQGRGIQPNELEPFLDDLRRVIECAWGHMKNCLDIAGRTSPDRVLHSLDVWGIGKRNQDLSDCYLGRPYRRPKPPVAYTLTPVKTAYQDGQ
ncbi:MAG: hypothetical protein HQL87_18710 [Magnetococcales bacterium]|nr:hypothetical protein [Magnetococcales bacterium]